MEFKLDLSEVEKFISSLPGANSVIEEEMKNAVQISLDAFEQAVVLETPVNTGTFRGSITTYMKGASFRLTGEVTTPLQPVYGIPLEFGRKAGKMPPLGPIALWLYRKGIVTDRKQIRSAAYLVARAIGEGRSRHQRQGGSKMFQKGFDNVSPAVQCLHQQDIS